MKIEAAIRDHLIEIEVGKYTPRTIKGYRTNLNLFLCFCKEKSIIEDMEDVTLGVVKRRTKSGVSFPLSPAFKGHSSFSAV